MGTSWGAALDYLIAGLTPVLQAVDANVQVFDNGALKSAEKAVWIGAGEPGAGENGDWSAEYPFLGGGVVEESYKIPGFIDVHQPGPVQKVARDAAIALFNPIVSFVAADRTLGGLLQSGRIASLNAMTPRQTQDDDDTGDGAMLRCTIAWSIAVRNTYIP